MSSRPACREGHRTPGPTSAGSASALRAASGPWRRRRTCRRCGGLLGNIAPAIRGACGSARLLDVGADLGVTQLGLGLTLELGLLDPDREDGGETSRTSSPVRFSSFSLSMPLDRAKSLIALVRALRKPSSWVPPSWVLMLLAKERTDSVYEVVHCMATSSSASSPTSEMSMMWAWSGSRSELRCLTKSTRPPL